jgi:hypothetical protein
MSNMLPPVWSVDPLVADNASIVVLIATHQQVEVAVGLSRADRVLPGYVLRATTTARQDGQDLQD